jgi:hypothetical protein
MALNFVEELPEDGVQPRSGNIETARLLKENPTTKGWANITKDKGYSKRATATAAAKAINDHTHPAYRDYGYQATVRTVKASDGTEQHLLYARYNPDAPRAGELAPETPKKVRKTKATPASDATTSAPETGDQTSDDTPAPAPTETGSSPAPKATVGAPARAAAKAPAAAKK